MEVNKQYPLAVGGPSQMVTLSTGNTFTQILKNRDRMGMKRVGKKNTSFWIPIKKNRVNVIPKPKQMKSGRVTFQQALRSTMVLGQVFSLIPVIGCWSTNLNDLRFVKRSWRCFYCALSFMGQLFMTLMCMWQMFNENSLKAFSATIFYGNNLITIYVFIKVAMNWPVLVQHIAKTEEVDPIFDAKLQRRCNITCAIILVIALFEHILSLLLAFAAGMKCYPDDNVYEGFVKYFYPWVFNAIPYSLALGISTQIFHFQGTFFWNFSDVFVITVSFYLTSRMEQVNRRLLAAQGKYLPEVFWKVSREDYGRVTSLVKKVDDVISGVVFISFANNLFFICLQLFNSLENGIKTSGDCLEVKAKTTVSKTNIFGGYESAVYFLFSLGFLIGRSIAVSLIASQICSASNVPATVLYDVPSPVYCVEVQRFLDQVNGDNVALTGLKFFDVTRGLLLTIVGTIVTYELVMVQFNLPSSTTAVNSTTTILPPMVSTVATG